MTFFSPTGIRININLNVSTATSNLHEGVRPTNIVFIGPTGAGKSRLINFLLNSDVAKTSMLTKSKTQGIQFYPTEVTSKEGGIDRRMYNLIDTQGLCDTVKTNEEVCEVIKKSVRQKVKHLNRIIIVLPKGRMDSLKREALESLIDMFDLTNKKRRAKVLIVITQCDGIKHDMLKQIHEDMAKDETLSKIHHTTLVTEIDVGKASSQDNICCVGLPDLEVLDEDLIEVYRPRLTKAWSFIWGTLLHVDNDIISIPNWLQKACPIQ